MLRRGALAKTVTLMFCVSCVVSGKRHASLLSEGKHILSAIVAVFYRHAKADLLWGCGFSLLSQICTLCTLYFVCHTVLYKCGKAYSIVGVWFWEEKQNVNGEG